MAPLFWHYHFCEMMRIREILDDRYDRNQHGGFCSFLFFTLFIVDVSRQALGFGVRHIFVLLKAYSALSSSHLLIPIFFFPFCSFTKPISFLLLFVTVYLSLSLGWGFLPSR